MAPPGVQPFNPLLSPDGRTIAFEGSTGSQSQTYIRSLNQLEAQPLSGTEGAFPESFSPDGQWLLITEFATAPQVLKRVPLAGGRPITVAEWPRGLSRGATWYRARTLLSVLQLAGPALDRPARGVARAEAESERDRHGDGTEQASEREIDDLVRQAHLPQGHGAGQDDDRHAGRVRPGGAPARRRWLGRSWLPGWPDRGRCRTPPGPRITWPPRVMNPESISARLTNPSSDAASTEAKSRMATRIRVPTMEDGVRPPSAGSAQTQLRQDGVESGAGEDAADQPGHEATDEVGHADEQHRGKQRRE